MALILTDLGADELLKIIFNDDRATAGNHLYLKLFCNDYTPVQGTTSASLTEANGGGYEDKELAMGSWTVTTANDPSDAVFTQQTFTFTGPLTTNTTVYGYYVTDADGVVIWAERFTTSFTPVDNGDNIKITPKFQMSSGVPS